MSWRTGRLATVIPESLLVITRSKIHGNIVVHMNIEKGQPFDWARRNKELILKCHANEKRCTKDSSRAKDSLLKVILDSRLGSRLQEPSGHSRLFRVRCGKSIFAEHHFFHRYYLVNRVVKRLSHWVNVTRITQGRVGSGVPKGRRRGSACLAWDEGTFDSSGERSILASSEKDF